MNEKLIGAFALLAAVQVAATGTASAAVPGKTLAVQSDTAFCTFLPPNPGQSIGASEESAVAFCTDPSLAPGAKAFPAGFIQSAHFAQDDAGTVQVTGRINPAAYQLSTSGGGGAYDMLAPVGASVAGYRAFTDMVEPDQGKFCVLASNDLARIQFSLQNGLDGCGILVPGDYS